MLRIESPNFNSTGSRLFGQNWRGLEAPRHLVLFNSDNMKQLLTKAGFVNIRHSGWMPQFELMYQASKNLQNGDAPETRNLNVHEQIRIKLIDSKLKRDASQREFFTYICYK